jgi:OmpA-OmpF porin, OOP family
MMTRFAAFTVFGLFGMAILLSAPPPAAAEHRFETKQTPSGSRVSAGSFEVAQKAPKSEAEKRKRRQKKKAAQARKRQQQQKQKAQQARKRQQQQKQKAQQARKRQQQQKQKAQQARKRQQQQKQKAQQARKRQQQQNQQARRRQQQQNQQARRRQQQRSKNERVRRQQQRVRRNAKRQAVQRRRVQQRRQVNRNRQQYRKLKRRRTSLQRQIRRNRSSSRYRAVRLKRQNQRLRRQRAWLRSQNRVLRRRPYRNFVFRERARVLERRRDRTVFAALAGAAVGAAIVGSYYVYHNDDSRIGWRARDVYVDDLDNGWTRNVVIRPDGTRVVTIRDGGGFIVRRYRVYPGNRVAMIYDNQPRWWNDGDLAVDVRPVRYTGPRERYIVEPSTADIDTVYDTVVADPVDDIDRTYTLNQILVNNNLRGYMPRIDLDSIAFPPGSSEIPEYQLDRLDGIGAAMEEAIKDNPNEVYLIEGHTDATGSDVDNLTLSDERAAAVANALTDYYDIPPENLVTQGYGEQFLKVDTFGADRRNRRVAIRRITPLLANESDDIALDDEGNEVFAQN